MHARLFASEISLHSFGSIQIFRLPHPRTDAASRFCSLSEIPMLKRQQVLRCLEGHPKVGRLNTWRNATHPEQECSAEEFARCAWLKLIILA